MKHPESKFTVVGGGILGYMEAYRYLIDDPKGKVVLNEAHPEGDAPGKHLVPSLSPGEMLAVVKFETLEKDLKTKFTEGGLYVDDVEGVNDSDIAKRFIAEAKAYRDSGINHQEAMNSLFEFGQKAMQFWQDFYNQGDDKLKQVLTDSYFNPCKENDGEIEYGKGYKPYIIIKADDKNAAKRAANTVKLYTEKGYKHTKVLSPDELIKLDSSLEAFVHDHSHKDKQDKRIWNDEAICVWAPGGCIHMPTFLPKFKKYLEEKAGHYVNDKGEEKPRFRVRNGRKVTGVEIEGDKATGIEINSNRLKRNKHNYQKAQYVICTGETVGTLTKLGFEEPASAGFAGTSLVLKIPATKELKAKYNQMKNYFGVGYDPVTCVLQTKLEDDHFIIGIGGTKAFYGAEEPNNDQEFARNRHLLQLNILNKLFPDFLKEALGKATRNQELNETDLAVLVTNKIAEIWVGRRNVVCDGRPIVGNAYAKDGTKLANVFINTGAGSGGNAYATALVELSAAIRNGTVEQGGWQEYVEMMRANRGYVRE